MAKVYDCIIIGGGPSGLAAGNILQSYSIDYLIIEKGNYLYKRNKKCRLIQCRVLEEVVYILTGKFHSFHLDQNYMIQSLYCLKILSSFNQTFQNISINIPKFDESWLNLSKKSEETNVFHNKIYDSLLLSQKIYIILVSFFTIKLGKKKFL